ncbi:hypothetical protein EPN28_01670 [Patescibacteria group bacterium]|nr:MAG: hypothetical protein EPN28_01670 [Patescibacteria group bacterium]
MTDAIMQKLNELGGNLEKVNQKLVEHDGNFGKINQKFIEHDAKFKEHDERFDKIDKKLADHEERLDLIARTVVDHTERLERMEETMATKNDIGKLSNSLDKIVGLMEKKDQELTLTVHATTKLEERVEKLEVDVSKMKPALGLS